MEGLAELPPPPALLPPAPLGALERGGGAPEASRVSPQEEAGIASEPDEAAAAASEETREEEEEEKQRGAGSSSAVLSEAAASLASRLEEPPPVAESARDATTPESPSQAEATAAPSPGSGSSGVSGPGSLSPAGGEESASLADSLGSFSNLPSCDGASISDLNGGGEDDDSEEAAAAAPRRAPVAGGEDDDEDGVSPSKGAAAGTASAAAASSSSSSASPSPLLLLPPGAKERFPGQSVYHIKWVRWKEENTPIITQNENGPCPLLAIMNVLLLAWKVKLPPMMEIITAEQLMEYLGDYILDAKPKEISEIQRLNYEQTADIVKAVGNCSYNQLVEKIICCKQSDNTKLVDEGSIAEQFLNNTATQLTYHGLCELTSTVQEGELCVFFRNNHFSTMTKHKGQLYLLVTDQGFLTEDKVVWESLHNVDGDGNFCDSEFHLRPPSDPETVYRGQQDQIDQDYLMALSLQQEQQSQDINWEQIPEGISDLELAKKLQEEEDRRASQYYQEQEQAAAATAAATAAQVQQVQGAASPSTGRQSGSSERKRKEPREKEKEREKEKNSCAIL
ncbi:ubiquitin carboxyl-terminal hydrolase MINDY-2 isoform X3 [Podarcis raffonei]|uniref:ubiquitin carboxyl-terminal hydrolase MINDY-2 isoform X3 n=1 Tax=Podarcis raffonei TaxID=65483 RepID=UPI0023294C80|nr:ubiquitin carboxyl-terminal hydrolase MINDY-2 isoform X3 [Podarcis raffonei]